MIPTKPIGTIVMLIAATLAVPAEAGSPQAAPQAAASRISPVVEAERAFAAMAQAKGISNAFRAWAADDALLLTPEPRNARDVLAEGPDIPGTLTWWPVYAGIARSQDLGFTTGPFVHENGGKRSHGWFFTLWKKQADGRWRWIFDHGPPTRDAAPEGPETRVAALPVAAPPPAPASCWEEMLGAEERLRSAIGANARTGYRLFLAEDGRVLRMGPQPAIGTAAASSLLASGPERIETRRLGGGISAAGDLGWTFGTARWIGQGGETSANYVRVWQRRDEGWRLIVDEMVPVPPAPPAPPAPAAAREKP